MMGLVTLTPRHATPQKPVRPDRFAFQHTVPRALSTHASVLVLSLTAFVCIQYDHNWWVAIPHVHGIVWVPSA